MHYYRFDGHNHSAEEPAWPRVLQKAYETGVRPLCLCTRGDDLPMMYIARFRDQYVLKRMPNSGSNHSSHCEHYEPPPELSGLGQVQGSAIRPNPDDGETLLSLDFALTKGRSRAPADMGDVEHESVRNDGTKLTLRALLHYLYDQSGLTRWTPAMKAKRNWFVVRRELLSAASDKKTKGAYLPELLYIPEMFFLDKADDIKRRQLASLSMLSGNPSKRMLVIAEVKSFEPARFGFKLYLKHVPNMPLAVNDELCKRINKVFAPQLALWNQVESSHLMMIGTISLSPEGIYSLETLCLMNVNEHWIPFDNFYDYQLLETLHATDRRFSKGLRYNLSSENALASAVLQDTAGSPTALFVVPEGVDDAYEAVGTVMQEQAQMGVWMWHTGRDPLPLLPERDQGSAYSAVVSG